MTIYTIITDEQLAQLQSANGIMEAVNKGKKILLEHPERGVYIYSYEYARSYDHAASDKTHVEDMNKP